LKIEPLHPPNALLDFTFFRIGNTPLTVGTLATAIFTIVVTMVSTALLERLVKRRFAARGVRGQGGAVTVQLLHYAMLAIGFSIAATTVGINLSALFAAGAVFAIGFGFAMQNIAQNFVAGVIILVERTIRPGDIIEIEGQVARVEEIGIRSTRVRTRFDVDIIVPNALLVQTNVKNYTLSDSDYRVHIDVGVAYATDIPAVYDMLTRAAEAIPWRVAAKQPIVLLTAFAANAVNFEVSVWCNDPWSARIRQSDLNLAIWKALKAANVTIAFPQLDVHFDPWVEHAAEKGEVFPRKTTPSVRSS
jgi:small-conductance mechanosensitive channel